MPRMTVFSRHSTTWLVAAAIASTGCHHQPATPPAPPPTDVSADNIAIVDSALVESGPELSGTLAPQRSAELRAQVAGEVLALPVKEGAPVSSGQIVAIMDSTALASAARSAQSQLTSAQLGADVAERNYQRSQNLHAAGAIADKDLETAHNQAVAADAAVADAKSKLATADKQLSNAVIRAPFAGVVSARPANVGDVLQLGNPIITIVDPTDLELDASVPAENIDQLKPGTKVEFSVNANPGKAFIGHIARVNPTVDSVTRQLKLYITVPNEAGSLAAGLFAQGRVALHAVRALAIPVDALDTRSTESTVHRVSNGQVQSVQVTLGIRDGLAERVEVTDGLARGDTVLIGAAVTTPNGTAVRITRANQ
jgi:RND family efflux transporter MFP subunit